MVKSNISTALQLIIQLSKAQTILSRKFDARLSGNSLGYTDFVILYHLSESHGEKLRRIDLADKLGVTASGVTRMLAPMEKIGLVSREVNERDARVSFVVLAQGGKRILEESRKTAENVAAEILPSVKVEKIEKITALLNEIIAGI